MTIQRKGIRLAKGESVLDAMKDAIPHWIHDTREDKTSVTGVMKLPSCTCSACGFHMNMEKPICPHCHAKMRSMKGLR